MTLLLDMASWFCLTVGSAFCVIGGVGILRLPDLYTRTHAASVTDTLGAGLVLLGLGLQAGIGLVSAKLLMVFVFMLLTGPAAAHALVKAAHAQGLDAQLDDEPGPGQGAHPSTPTTGENE